MALSTACGLSVQSVPDYSPGFGGWRQDHAIRGNDLAGQGVHGAAGQGLVSFFGWLLAQAQTVDSMLLAGPLPE